MTRHDDELRETRLRWRELHDAVEFRANLLRACADQKLRDYLQATYDLAKAYYEQFASDNEAAADADWLEALEESLGDELGVLMWLVRSADGCESWKLEKVGKYGQQTIVHLSTSMTRGQVRRLLTAMGIEVRQ